MTILSIDVGMKHLAYCVLDKGETVSSFTIKDWNIINLCNQPLRPTCMGCINKNKQCDKKSRYYKNNKYFCKLHAKKEAFKIPTSNIKLSKLEKTTLTELKNIAEKNDYEICKKAKKKDYIECIKKDLSNNYFNIFEDIDSRKVDIITFGKRIKTCFDTIVKDFDVDCLLIENQIGPLALRMKMLQGMIIQHFIEIGCSNIKEISPTNKLKDFIPKNKKTTYNERKKMGIDVTRKIIEEDVLNQKWREHFEKHNKKDDLADAFLQVIWFIKQ